MATPPVLNIGFYNYVMTDKIVAVVNADSAPMRRLVQSLRKTGNIIDATHGRKTKCVIYTTSEDIILSAINQETLIRRLSSGDIASGEIAPDDES